MRRSKKKTSDREATEMQEQVEVQEQEAVAAARDALARVIADCGHSDRSRAIEAIQAIDRGWEDDRIKYSVSFRLTRVYDARFNLLGSFSESTDRLPDEAPTQMQAALYTIDYLASVLLARLGAIGVAVYPTMDPPEGQMLELPSAEKDNLLSAIEHPPAD